MCLTSPQKIIKIDGNLATVMHNGREQKVNISLLKNPKSNDWILINANLAIKKISKREAEEIMKIIKTAKINI